MTARRLVVRGATTAAGLILWLGSAGVAVASGPTSVSFTAQGCTTWTVPAGVSVVQIQATGAAGGDGFTMPGARGGAGGLGDGVSGTLSGLSGGSQVLDVCVDQGGGSNVPGGAGASLGGDGGGASGVSLASDFSDPVLVAGGGGGGGVGQLGVGDGGAGGSAGIPVAGAGGPGTSGFGPGGGGDNTAATGGAGGVSSNPACSGTSGGQTGAAGPGAGGVAVTTFCAHGGGGGGGGYFGGGGGASSPLRAPGGGGGTDFCAAAVTGCSVVSGAGSSPGAAQVTLTYDLPDLTPPTDAPVASPAANPAGWNATDVVVDWSWTDSGSGIDAAHCTQHSASVGEGVQSLTSSCADLAGNIASDAVQVKVDKTKPVDNPVVTTTATGASVAWNWTDPTSGVDPASCTQSSSQTGTGQLTLTSTCTDVAGNTATDSRTVTVAAPATKADVQVAITGPATGRTNTSYTYTVISKNVGPAVASQVGTTVLLPQGATLVSASGTFTKVGPLVVWKTVPSLAVNASTTYTVTVKFATKGTTGLAAATASVSTQDPNLLNNAAAVVTKVS